MYERRVLGCLLLALPTKRSSPGCALPLHLFVLTTNYTNESFDISSHSGSPTRRAINQPGTGLRAGVFSAPERAMFGSPQISVYFKTQAVWRRYGLPSTASTVHALRSYRWHHNKENKDASVLIQGKLCSVDLSSKSKCCYNTAYSSFGARSASRLAWRGPSVPERVAWTLCWW